MRTRREFKAQVVEYIETFPATLKLKHEQFGLLTLSLAGFTDEKRQELENAAWISGTLHYSVNVREGGLAEYKFSNLQAIDDPNPKQEETKSLSKEFNGKIVMELDDMEFTMVVETETLGTLHVPTRSLGLVFEQYQAMRDKGVVGTYEIEDDANDVNTKKIKVTGLKPKA